MFFPKFREAKPSRASHQLPHDHVRKKLGYPYFVIDPGQTWCSATSLQAQIRTRLTLSDPEESFRISPPTSAVHREPSLAGMKRRGSEGRLTESPRRSQLVDYDSDGGLNRAKNGIAPLPKPRY